MFRVTISGTFDALDEAGRQAVREAGGMEFTEAGTFTHDAGVSAFTFRCQVPAGEAPDPDAAARALAALDGHGHAYRVLRVAVTDMRDLKIRRKRR
ncbi:DUF6204 family protein [Nonomuraea rhizosphaerae]|uniref:DUF6204 family protein n=1 Tax=Nonomuraea rhizosphaerae TaxID=2665663 RepID=UPI001C5D60A4|nr:DUF6204 family protein [Nonomuraea rhizosphaerae]